MCMQYYADVFMQRAKSSALEDQQADDVRTLLHQTLDDLPSQVFSSQIDHENSNMQNCRLKHQATLI